MRHALLVLALLVGGCTWFGPEPDTLEVTMRLYAPPALDSVGVNGVISTARAEPADTIRWRLSIVTPWTGDKRVLKVGQAIGTVAADTTLFFKFQHNFELSMWARTARGLEDEAYFVWEDPR